jgi:hypothetical protein
LAAEYEKGKTLQLTNSDVHDISSLLKLFFRDLSDRPFEMSLKINATDEQSIPLIRKEVQNLENSKFETLKRLIGLLHSVHQNREFTRMVLLYLV